MNPIQTKSGSSQILLKNRNVEDYVEFLVESWDGRVVEFIDFAKKNYPEQATVKEVVEEPFEGSVMSLEGFYRSFSLNQLVEIVNVGVSMLGKQDKTLEKQDQLLGKMDTMLEKQDALIDEVRSLRNDLKAYMDERFRRIELEITKIKEKIGIV